MKAKLFPHLRVRSHYSMHCGLAHPGDLVAAAAERGVPALGLMDQANMFGALKFYKAALKGGVQPILGLDLPVQGAPGFGPGHLPRIGLLARNREGYRSLLALASMAHLDCGDASPRVGWQALRQHAQGLAALAGSTVQGPYNTAELARGEVYWGGVIPLPGGHHGGDRNGKGADIGYEALRQWQECFGDDFYLEAQRLGRSGEERALEATVELAQRAGAAIVATNDVCFLDPQNWEQHEARVCVAQGMQLSDAGRHSPYVEAQHLADADAMRERFADLPAALENTLALARRCGPTAPLGEGPHTPAFDTEGDASLEDYLRSQSRGGLQRRLEIAAARAGDVEARSGKAAGEAGGRAEKAPAKSAGKKAAPGIPKEYADRLDHELGIITGMGFAGYYLIVMEFVGWARQEGIPVGPGRGSGAGSLVAWALGITDVDPIRHGLLFERFLNPQRVSMPDFDIDFCPKGRDRVIDHVVQRYGREAVAQIAALGTMAARAAIKDAARVLGHAAQLGDRMAKQVPEELGMTLGRAQEISPSLKEMLEGEAEAAIFDLALGLEGRARNVSRHAGGVVIAPGPLREYAPLYRDPGSNAVLTQYDKKDLEDVGLIKFDFLGLTTLTVIEESLQAVNADRAAAGQAAVDFDAMGTGDEAVYASLTQGTCTGVFQLESEGMRNRVQEFAASSLEELCALGAVIRPGPLQSGMYDTAVQVKRGDKPLALPHEKLKGALQETWGVFLYQEQVMEAARVLAGYSYAEADELRRAMGDKNRATMARHRPRFCEAAAKHMPMEQAEKIYDDIAEFADYGFNKSHSLCYAVLSYRTAWLKHHYPAHFFAAALNCDFNNPNRVEKLLAEVRRMGLEVLPPHVNHSGVESAPVEAGGGQANGGAAGGIRENGQGEGAGGQAVRLGLALVKSLGQQAAGRIVEGRAAASGEAGKQGEGGAGAPFADLFDFCRRSKAHTIGERAVQALVAAGALEGLVPNKATGWEGARLAIGASEQYWNEQSSGQGGLFDDLGGPSDSAGQPQSQLQQLPEWGHDQLIGREHASLGLHLQMHPLDMYAGDIRELGCVQQPDPLGEHDELALIGLLRFAERRHATRGGQSTTLCTLGLDTGCGGLVRAEILDERTRDVRDALRPGTLVLARLRRPGHWMRPGQRLGRVVWDLDGVEDMGSVRAGRARALFVQVRARARGQVRQAAELLRESLRQGPGCKLVVQLGDESLAVLGDLEVADGQRHSIQPGTDLRERLHTLPAVVSASYRYGIE